MNHGEMYAKNGIIELNASDHNLVYAVRKQPKIEKSYHHVWGRSYRKFDSILFERDIIFHDWSAVTNQVDPNLAWNAFVQHINTILDISPQKVAKNPNLNA